MNAGRGMVEDIYSERKQAMVTTDQPRILGGEMNDVGGS